MIMVFKYFSYIVAVSFIGGGNRCPGENHDHWETLSYNIVSSTPRTYNLSGDRHWLHM